MSSDHQKKFWTYDDLPILICFGNSTKKMKVRASTLFFSGFRCFLAIKQNKNFRQQLQFTIDQSPAPRLIFCCIKKCMLKMWYQLPAVHTMKFIGNDACIVDSNNYPLLHQQHSQTITCSLRITVQGTYSNLKYCQRQYCKLKGDIRAK